MDDLRGPAQDQQAGVKRIIAENRLRQNLLIDPLSFTTSCSRERVVTDPSVWGT